MDDRPGWERAAEESRRQQQRKTQGVQVGMQLWQIEVSPAGCRVIDAGGQVRHAAPTWGLTAAALALEIACRDRQAARIAELEGEVAAELATIAARNRRGWLIDLFLAGLVVAAIVASALVGR